MRSLMAQSREADSPVRREALNWLSRVTVAQLPKPQDQKSSKPVTPAEAAAESSIAAIELAPPS